MFRIVSRIALALSLSLAGVDAADITVSNANNSGAGSLRQAIVDVSAGGSIDFTPALSGQTITLATEILLNKGVTIDASSLADGMTISGGGNRLLSVGSSGNLMLRCLTLSGGNGLGVTSSGSGGAIYNSGTVTVERGTLSGNSAAQGGAILNALSATLTITNSTLSGNSSSQNGGSIANFGTLTLESSTLSSNTAVSSGGGIYNPLPASLTLNNTIVAGNNPASCLNIAGIWSGNNNLTSGSPGLQVLNDYGGPTRTMPPATGSPAIDAGGATALTIDQRGLARVLEVGLDIGACETTVVPAVVANDLTIYFNPTGLTIYGRLAAADSAGVFEISTDSLFRPSVTTYAGTGTPGFADDARLSSQFNNPSGVAQDSEGNIFIADTSNNRIRMIDAISGAVSTIAGDSTGTFGLASGPGQDARFAFPTALAVGPDDNVYVADTYNHRICKLTRPSSSGGNWIVTNLAGPTTPGTSGFTNGSPSNARFNHPYGLALDENKNVYVADSGNHRIRKITPSGTVSTYAGSGTQDYIDNAAADSASFDTPRAVAFYSGSVYVGDTFNHCIRKILPNGINAGAVSTLTGSLTTAGFVNGSAAVAQFDTPSGLASDGNGRLYVADENNHAIREVLTTNGAVTTVAGNGVAARVDGLSNVAQFDSPTGLLVALDGNLVVADSSNHVLRHIDIKPVSVPYSIISSWNGASDVLVNAVLDIAALGLNPGGTYYFRWKSTLNTQTGTYPPFVLYDLPVVTTAAASIITPTAAQLNATVNPKSSSTTVEFEYSTDPDLLNPYEVSAFVGSGVAGFANDTGAAARFSDPFGVVADACGDVYVADRLNHQIRKITAAGVVTTFAGSGAAGFANGTGAAAIFERPSGIAVDSNGNFYVADEYNHCIRMITPTGVVSTFAGIAQNAGFADDAKASAKFRFPRGVAVDSANNVYVADTGNHRIRRIDAISGLVTTLAGTGGAAFTDGNYETSQFSSPLALAVTLDGKVLVADTGNHRIRMIESGVVSTFAGSGNGFLDGAGVSAQFSSPTGIALDAIGVAYVTDQGNHRIRRIGTDRVVTTFAGSGIADTVNSPSFGSGLYPTTACQFNGPSGVGIDSTGSLFITQEGLVRKIARSAALPTVTVTPNPTGSAAISVSAYIPEPLRYGSTYYFRAKGTNARGLTTGGILSFVTTQAKILVYDGDGVSDPAILHDQTAELDFGTTPRGQPVMRAFTISNPGSSALTVSSINVPSGYLLTSGVVNPIPALGSATFQVSLSAAVGSVTYPGDVTINCDAHDQPVFSFPITGLVLNPPVVTTDLVSDTDIGTATFNATVNPQGSATSVWFQWSVDENFDGVYVTTLAASGFNQPSGMATDANGNIFIADRMNHRIRRMDATTGEVTTFAGSGVAGYANGTGASAQFNEPVGLAINKVGVLFVSDSKNHRIRAIDTVGQVSTYSGAVESVVDVIYNSFTDGIASAARYYTPLGLAIDADGVLYVADSVNQRIRKVATDGSVSTISGTGVAGYGNGVGTVAQFTNPVGIAVDSSGSVYVTEAVSHAIRKIEAGGLTSIFAGAVVTADFVNATGAAARFSNPVGLTVNADDKLYVTDAGNQRIRIVDQAGIVTTIAGTNTAATVDGYGDTPNTQHPLGVNAPVAVLAQFSTPISIATTASGEVIVGESGSSAIRKIASLQVLLQAGPVPSGTADVPVQLVVNGLPTGLMTYFYRAIASNGGGTITGTPRQSAIVYEYPAVVTEPATSLTPITATLNATVDPKLSPTQVVFQYSTDPALLNPYEVKAFAGSGVAGFADGIGAFAQFSNPSGVVTDSLGNVFVADRENHRIRKIDSVTGEVTTFAGSAVMRNFVLSAVDSPFEYPSGIAIDSNDNLYVADEYNHQIRKITPTGVVSTFAGNGEADFADGPKDSAMFLYPSGVAVDTIGNVYVADTHNHRIRKIDAITGLVSTLAGTGDRGVIDGDFATSQFSYPKALAVTSGGKVLVADTGSNRIRLIESGNVSTYAGTGNIGHIDGPGVSARFASPFGITLDTAGMAYVTDAGNHRIRRIDTNGTVTTIAGSGSPGNVNSPDIGLYSATACQFNTPNGIWVDASGALFITQEGLVRKLARRATLPTLTVIPDPTGSGQRLVSAAITEPLRYGTTYYFRALGTNGRGLTTGEILSFVTSEAKILLFNGPSVSDPTILHNQSTKVNFGITPKGQQVTRSFTISNPGTWPLNVSNVTVPAGYQLTGGTGVINPSDSLTFDVTLLAGSGNTYSGDVVITCDAPDGNYPEPLTGFSFPVTGLALDPPVLTTLPKTNVGTGTATFHAIVNPRGSSTTVWFEWSLDSEFDGVDVKTLAGSTAGYVEGVGPGAKFNHPSGLATDAIGNIFVADSRNHRIRKIAPNGTTTTYAGTGVAGFNDGPSTSAQFDEPVALAMNRTTGVLYVAESKNHRIRAINPGGNVETYCGSGEASFTDGVAGAARFNNPHGMAIDSAGVLYIADSGNNRIRKVALDRMVTTLSGTGNSGFSNGDGTVAEFTTPVGIAVDSSMVVYVTESSSHGIRKVNADGFTSDYVGSRTTAGFVDAMGNSARFSNPEGLVVDSKNQLYVADRENHRIRMVDADGDVITIAGSETSGAIDGYGKIPQYGLGVVAQFSKPYSLASKASGGVIVGQSGSSTIRDISPIQTVLLAATGLNGTSDIPVQLAVTGLPTDGTPYFYRSIATNGGGTTIANGMASRITTYRDWQITMFGLNDQNPLISGVTASPAGDGFPNLIKYAYQLDPLVRVTTPIPTVTYASGQLGIEYKKFPRLVDLELTVQWSTDMVNWYASGITNVVTASQSLGNDDDYTTYYSYVTDAPDRQKFIRLVVTAK